jgi:hypothetical protein
VIGGASFSLRSNVEPEDVLRQAFLLIQRRWPTAVAEDAASGELLWPSVPFVTFVGRREIMVYTDSNARESWGHLGADPSNSNTMIHVLAATDSVTLIVDDPNDKTAHEILEGIKKFLANDIFHIPAEVAA